MMTPMKHFFSAFFLVTTLLCTTPGTAMGCPEVIQYLDPNCDGKIRLMITGDSIVRGIGDKKELGYPGRLQELYGDSPFRALNIGVPGATPQVLRRAFIRNIDRGRQTTRFTEDIDYGLIQIGTNNYWSGEKPFQVVMQIYRLKKYLERALEERNGTRPVLFTATVPYTERDYQNPFISELNRELLRKKGLNVLVRFDRIPVSRLKIEDTLHPSGGGYRKMARIAKRGLKRIQRRTTKLFTDGDSDGVYDQAEVGRFLTDPEDSDSDDDLLSDGEELLTYKTNPNNADTDGDEVDDRTEILNGTDPSSAESF
jgi:lysophospholipase L1-like esterase